MVKYLTYFSFTIRYVNMTNPIQLTYSNKLKYIISPSSSINYYFLQFSFTLIPPNILLKILLKVASHSAICLFKTHHVI